MLENATNLTNTTSGIGVLRGLGGFLSDYWQELSALAAIITIISVVIGLFFKRYLQKKQHEHEKEMEKLRQEYEDDLRQKDIQNAIAQASYVLNDFATSWETLRGNEKVDLTLRPKSVPVLQKGENIKTIITGVSSKLPDSYVGEALDIANQLIHLKNEVGRSLQSGLAIPIFHASVEIDKLAERAKECATKLGGKK